LGAKPVEGELFELVFGNHSYRNSCQQQVRSKANMEATLNYANFQKNSGGRTMSVK
jgi:hypothetical protein